MARWRIDLDDRNRDWTWKKIEDDGTVSMTAHRSFRYYLDCFLDAERHGMTMPLKEARKPGKSQ
jgi:hypothetical protein